MKHTVLEDFSRKILPKSKKLFQIMA